MPLKRRRGLLRRNRRKRAPGLATAPRLMTTYQKKARWNNVSSKVFYIKDNGTLNTDLNGTIEQIWSVQDATGVTQFTNIKALYDQYKVVAMTVRLYPANVGTEPDASLFSTGVPGLVRGNCGVWSDQRPGTATQFPATINGMINYGSARLINPRRPYHRSLFRAKGFPDWGGVEATAEDDQWSGTINLLQLAGSASSLTTPITMWYWTRTFKIVFRGRRQN